MGANAVLGGVRAREHRFDIVGLAILAITSGLGGGIIRDTMLQRGPPLALTARLYLITAAAGALVAYLVRVHGRAGKRSHRFVDALALGCRAAAGAERTLSVGLVEALMIPALFVLIPGDYRCAAAVIMRVIPAPRGLVTPGGGPPRAAA